MGPSYFEPLSDAGGANFNAHSLLGEARPTAEAYRGSNGRQSTRHPASTASSTNPMRHPERFGKFGSLNASPEKVADSPKHDDLQVMEQIDDSNDAYYINTFGKDR